jgi:ribosome-associated protein
MVCLNIHVQFSGVLFASSGAARANLLRLQAMNVRAFTIPDHEVEWSAIRAQGAGGQHVNKVSSAVHLRFDIRASSLPPEVKEKLLALSDQRITADGVVVIKAQSKRSQEGNLADAMARLHELVALAAKPVKPRKATQPTFSARMQRVNSKVLRGQIKAARGKVTDT